MTKSGLLIAAMIAMPVIFAERLILPVTANAATGYECNMRNNYCRSGCATSDKACFGKCDQEWVDCLGDDVVIGHARPERPKGRPIKNQPQGLRPTGGILDTTPGLPGQGPASTGGAVINAKPSAPPQIR